MNPLLLLLLGLGGFMGVMGGSGSGTGSTSQPATNNPGNDDDDDASPGGTGGAQGAVEITMVVYDMAGMKVVQEIGEGDEIDFGTDATADYVVAAEVPAGTAVGSMLLTYGGQTWLQNSWPYTLEDSPLDLAEGDFDIEVTAYSGANATGNVLGQTSLFFTTTSTEPVVEEEVEEPPVVDEGSVEETPPPPPPGGTPTAPEQSGDGGTGGGTDPIAINGTVKVVAGRVSTLEPQGDDIASLKIVSGLSHGKVTVNPDNTFAVVLSLSDKTSDQSFTYEAARADGSTTTHKVNLDVVAGEQAGGWATGASHYMLATDENDDVVVETGENHTKVHISGAQDALSLADIAKLEGMSVSQVTGNWLAEQGGYGQSENLALSEDAGMALWNAVTPRGSVTSNHLLLERGYEYDNLGRILQKGTYGEDELHPLYIGSWGEGDKPLVTTQFKQDGDGSTNLVVQGVEFSGGVAFLINGENLIFDNLSLAHNGMNIQHQDSVTVRNSDFTDIYRKTPGNDQWDPMDDRIQGLYAGQNNGLLLEGNFFDYNSWREGYNFDGTTSYQSPSMFSHNMYIQSDNIDVALRDTVSMRASSFGANIRTGGFFEDNVLIDNNAGFNNLGGDYLGHGPVGSYALFQSNLITSGAYKDAEMIGARAWAMRDSGEMSTLLDNIIAHLADPNNPAELNYKLDSEFSYSSDSAYYDDTIVWNWKGANQGTTDWPQEQNIDNLNESFLDQTTIQLFTAQLLNQETATIADLAEYLRVQANGTLDNVVDADLIIRFFQEGFGIAPDIRIEAETARFVPNDLGDGVRWDNRMNWTTEDLPGFVAGDSADLGGNTVVFNGNAEINELEFGPGGRLELYGGKLEATGGLTTSDPTGGEVLITDAGQLWADGHAGESLDIDIEGGRFVNTGAIKDASLTASDGQAILATGGAIYGVSGGETLSATGAAEMGFDDDDGGVALLAFEQGSTLSLGTDDGKLGSIEEFRSGAFGDSPDVRSGIDLGDAMLEVDVAGLTAGQGEDLTLLDADELIGAFDNATFSGLGTRDATVVIDYVNDSVSLKLADGSGKVAFQTVGQATDVSDGEQALWDALTAGQGVFDEVTPDAVLPENEEEYLEAI